MPTDNRGNGQQQGSGKSQPDTSAAEGLVFENLGLTGDDLGVEREGALDRDDSLDRGDDRDDARRFVEPDREEQELDDLRVSHTDDDRRPFATTAEVRPDKNGNLVDSNGNIVARRGREARLYQTAFKRGESSRAGGLQRTIDQRTGQLREAVSIMRDMDTELKTLKAVNKQIEELGVPKDKHVEALTLYKSLTSDMAGTLKRLLTRAAANGINIDNFGQGSLDAKALADVVKEEVAKLVKPLQDSATEDKKRRDALDQQSQVERRAQQEVNDFFSENREAVPYARVLQRLLASPEYRGRSLREVWLEVQLHLAHNPHQRRSNPGTQRRSLPTGRGTPERGNSSVAPVNTSYDEILRDVFREHGI